MIIFAVLIIIRIARYASLPVHLRWELYPIAHETKRPYGGSYFEDLDWWKKTRSKNLLGELKFMGIELFFFRLYYRLNKKYWFFVYPFHMGAFLLVALLILFFIGALTYMAGINISAVSVSLWGRIIYYLTLIVGVAGLIITGFGCLGLLIKRLTDKNLKRYTAPMDYFNLLFILAIVVSGLAGWFLFDPGFDTARDFIRSLITFTPVLTMNPATFTFILLICLFLIYSPFTRMTHYVAKYFTYHKVLWDDEPNFGRTQTSQKVRELLNQTPDWSGSHIQADKSWAQLVKDLPEDKIGDPKP